MRGADILVDMLIGYGVDTIFGVPGDTNVPFYKALQREDRIRHVMARDERSAGFMADAYGRFTNKPGVFECPSGAGAMYSLPPVAESNGSSVPVILLTIDIPCLAKDDLDEPERSADGSHSSGLQVQCPSGSGHYFSGNLPGLMSALHEQKAMLP